MKIVLNKFSPNINRKKKKFENESYASLDYCHKGWFKVNKGRKIKF
jgi:hypothetical protein